MASIGGMFIILGVAQILVERSVILPSFAALEQADARVAMRRIQNSFDLTLDRIAMSAADWGNWADVYRFMQDHNLSLVNEDLTESATRQIGANVVLIVDLDGNVEFARTVDLKSNGGIDLDFAANKSLPPRFPWRAKLHDGQRAKGLLRTNRGILMLAGGPILDGNGHGPSRGMVIMGRLLTSPEISNIGDQAQAKVSLLTPPDTHRLDQLSQSDKFTYVDRDFDDVFGHPIMTLRVDVPREISAHGRTAVAYASACLLAAAIVVLILLLLLLSRVILNPLAVVTRHAVAVGKDKDLSTRLALVRRDEIGVLAREFDCMVQRVAESRTQLVDQSFAAGYAELAKGVLHNLGNAITPIGVRLAGLAERLRRAPVEDAARAAAELQGGVADA